MWGSPIVAVVGFFTLIGLSTVGRLAVRLNYWATAQKVKYTARVTTTYAAVGVVASVGTVGYIVAPHYTTMTFAVVWLIPFVGALIVIQEVDFSQVPSSPSICWAEWFTHRYPTVLPAFGLGSVITIPFAFGLMSGNEILLGGWLLSGAALGFVGRRAEVSHDYATQKDDLPGMKNVVICMVDSLRRDRMSLYGYNRVTTPFLDRTCDDAYVFQNCIAPGTRSGHSIPSLLTGTYASQHDYGRNLDKLFLLSDVFREQGYTTMAISGNPHVATSRFGDRFDWFVYLRRGKNYLFAAQRLVTRTLAKLGLRHIPSHYFFVDIEFINELAMSSIAHAAERDEPFFCYLSYMDIHYPFVREFNYVKTFAEAHGTTVEQGPWIRQRDGHPTYWYNKSIRNWGYDETVWYTDKHLAELFEFLENHNLRDETVVVITSDHGELLGEHDYWGHIDVPFNPLIEVPLLIYPSTGDDDDNSGISEHNCKIVSRLISGTNVPSLVCDAAGVDPSKAIQEQWVNNLTLSDCLSTEESEVYCFLDNASEAISTKGYEHPITGGVEQYDSLPETTIEEQRLLVGKDWKLYQVNDDFRFYRYGDSFFEDMVPDDEVPDGVRTSMHAEMADIDAFLEARSDETLNEPYSYIKRESVRQQLNDLGYL